VIESVELLPPDSLVYRRWGAAQAASRVWDRWALFIFVGIATGLAGFAVHAGVDILAFIKASQAPRSALCFSRGRRGFWVLAARLADARFRIAR